MALPALSPPEEKQVKSGGRAGGGTPLPCAVLALGSGTVGGRSAAGALAAGMVEKAAGLGISLEAAGAGQDAADPCAFIQLPGTGLALPLLPRHTLPPQLRSRA